MAAASPPSIRADGPSSGQLARELIQHQLSRLGHLQVAVLTDRDPEALHQLRVSLRRLRTALAQFGPALELPDGVTVRRLAAVTRRSSRCRDLDVMRMRLTDELMPGLPDGETRRLQPLIRRIDRERAQALEAMKRALESARHRRLMARLHRWRKRPRLSALGGLPLCDWLYEWQEPFTSGLFLHAGWMCEDPQGDALHALRRRIKGARYSLEALEPWCSPTLQRWIHDLRLAQDHLGELHDLQILGRLLARQEQRKAAAKLPTLTSGVAAAQQAHWLQWRQLAGRLGAAGSRHALRHALAELGTGAAIRPR